MSKLQKTISFRAFPQKVEDDVIYGCSVCTEGPALGHGVMLDRTFINEVYKQGKRSKVGLKARFGHPNMCNESLGTYIGRFKNFKISDDESQVYADLHIAKSSHNTPHGDLGQYIVDLAKDDPEAFGTSIVFNPGESYYEEDDEGNVTEYATCDKLLGCDFVDEPAANPNGLFSSATVAGKVTQFLDAHPEVVSALSQDDDMIEIISSYGKNAAQFISKYKENFMIEETKSEEIELEAEVKVAEEATELDAGVEGEDVAENVVEDETVEVAPSEPAPSEPDALSAYRSMIKTYGLAIADRVLEEGGTELDAIRYKNEALESDLKKMSAANETLKDQVKQLNDEIKRLSDESANDAVSFVDSSRNPISELTGLAKTQAALKAKKK